MSSCASLACAAWRTSAIRARCSSLSGVVCSPRSASFWRSRAIAISSALFGASSWSAIGRSYDRPVDDADLYRLIGEEGFRRLVGGFYAQVPGDDILGPMYPPEDLAGA